VIEHNFKIVSHLRIGPIRNRWGWIFYAAEIDDMWFLRWITPQGGEGNSVHSTHFDLLQGIDNINRRSSFEP
jgi:hypothetical protein